jgi:hypothetical protein
MKAGSNSVIVECEQKNTEMMRRRFSGSRENAKVPKKANE